MKIPWWPRNRTDQLQQELQSHLDMATRDRIDRGESGAQAAQCARREFGNVQLIQQVTRDQWGWCWLEELLLDLRFGARVLRKNPGFTTVAVLTLALGIGANTAIFSVVYAVLLKPLPFANSEQLFNVFQQQAQDATVQTGWSYANFAELRQQNHVFSEMAGSQRHQLTLTGRGEPFAVNTSVVTPEFFSVFEGKPLSGRVFYSADGKAGAAPVVILSETLWRGSLGADPNIIGSSLTLDKRSFTVVGVMPAAFRFPQITDAPQLWIPLAQDPLFGPWMEKRSGHWLQVTARVRPGIPTKQLRAEMDSFATRIAREFPAENEGWLIRMVQLQQLIVEDVKPALLVLLGAVGLVLLIACANIANLLLARGTSRAREIAVRAALGAGRARIVRQLLSETAVLGLLGGVAGVALAYWGVQILATFLPPGLPLFNAVRIDFFVLAFALALSAIAAVAFGSIPAFLAARSALQISLREGGTRCGESSGGRRARNVLAVAEIALAMMLLVAAGLLLRSFANLTSVDPGFDVQHMVKAEVSLPRFQYSTQRQWISFADDLLMRVQSGPGLKNSAFAVPLPIADGFVNLAFDIPGTPPATAATSRTADYVAVSSNYFHTIGIPLLAGRVFDQRDALSSPRVAIISKTMARLYFADRDPLGKQIVCGFPPDPWAARQIVGIVGDVRDVALGNDPKPMMYVPFAQAPFPGAVLIVKSTLGVSSVAAAIRQEVAKIDKDLPVTEVAAMPDILNTSLAQPRFRTSLLGLFAAVALILAAIGIFGVISYSVSRRTQEIGIRVALGASRGSVLRLVSREVFLLTSAGVLIGIIGALAASRLLGHLLFGVSASDPLTLVCVALALALVAALAAYIPARRAMRVDPIIALRYE